MRHVTIGVKVSNKTKTCLSPNIKFDSVDAI